MMRYKYFTIVFLVFALLSFCSNAWALIAAPEIFCLDFRFNSPGARANAMGGAFIGLADDATAAYSNPAGLTILTKSELSLEYKYGNYSTHVHDYYGKADFETDVVGLSFMSYVHPAEKASITLFRHRLLNSESGFTYHEESDIFPGVIISTDTKVELDAVTYGLGFGLKITDSLSLGLTLGFAQCEFYSDERRLDPNAPRNVKNHAMVDSMDSAEHYTLSLLWNIFDELNFGIVYRQGPEFIHRRSNFELEPPKQEAGPGETRYYKLFYDWEFRFKVPDSFGIGFSYRFFKEFTFVLDGIYIEYSDLFDELLNPQTMTQWPDFKADDEWEIRAGLEYIIEIKEIPVALRAGYYYRPDHRVYYTGDTTGFPAGAYLQKRVKDDHIYSLGFGAVIFENLQLDIAGNYGDLAQEGYLSLVYRFE